ncbi:hypothetical protein HW450_11575 [Corynebacterium hindlerae]|uniref:Uncharacterized protein n=1 Tax=Corynebacterium hindlerae TaxID=699041 RepID=A0A7G5FEB4_9CORY|nr:hypothetical protein [Corynebacterium hindlerae]QMV84955.1 hypothetical protein HW450_11575 [Corynebacterium hindlerae]QTH59147.1 hypothetical protein J5O04_10075 [Corynebacterium hindlerae]
MGISMSLDLSTATLAELAALVNAAQAAGVDPETAIRVTDDQLTIDVGVVTRPAPQHVSPVDPLRDTVRQVLGEEAVRGVLDSFITKNPPRKP